MYKLIKLTRLLRILKIVKDKSKILKSLQNILKIGVGFERMLFFILMSFMIIHIISCLWVFMAKISIDDTEEEESKTWVISNDYEIYHKQNPTQLYLISVYYVITTMTTVGYGDISPTKVNSIEMVFGICLMIGGVIAFTFASASLASILSNYDN